MYGKLEKTPATYRKATSLFQHFDSEIVKNSILEEVFCYRIPRQTLSFLTSLPTCQDGLENRDKAYYILNRQSKFSKAMVYRIKFPMWQQKNVLFTLFI